MSQPLPPCVCGDAREPAAYAKALGGAKADALITDPPYCLLTRRRKGGEERDPRGRKLDHEIVVRFETVRDYRAFTERWLPLALSQLKPGAPAIIWTNFLGKDPILAVARAAGYGHLHGEFVWGKRTKEGGGNEVLVRVYEVALVLGQAPLPELPPEAPPRCWSAIGLYADPDADPTLAEHPHHKPFYSLEPLIRSFSRPGERVLDPFAGSGSIPTAAARLGRVPASIELVPEWADKVSQRLASVGRST
jgi:site-specific DNA-methyltransferase (adenine-specific)